MTRWLLTGSNSEQQSRFKEMFNTFSTEKDRHTVNPKGFTCRSFMPQKY